MRILHLATSLEGGAGTTVVRLCEAQKRRGDISKILSIEELLNNASIAEKWTYVVKRLKSKITTLTLVILTKQPFSLMTSHSTSTISRKQILDFKPDVVHIHNWFNLLNLEDIDWIIKTFPTVFTLHDERLLTGGCHYRLGCKRYDLECRKCPGLKLAKSKSHKSKSTLVKIWQSNKNKYYVIAPSNWLLKLAEIDAIGLNARRNTVVHNAYELNVKAPGNRHRTLPGGDHLKLMFVAANCKAKSKGLDIILDTLPSNGEIISKKFKLWIVGAKLSPKLIKKYRYIEYFGNVSTQMIHDLMKKADLLIVPSRSDNSPNVVIEAQLNKLAVIAARQGGIPELFSEKNNSRLFQLSTTSLLKAIENFVMNGMTRDELEDSYQAAVERHNPSNIAELHFQIYNQVISGRNQFQT